MKLKNQKLPDRSQKFVASELLHGDVEGFIINGYLALQRQWPDDGGFKHFKHQLASKLMDRPQVLRQIASSQSAKHMGIVLVDDLGPDYKYAPSPQDEAQREAIYQATSQRLRLQQVAHELRETREVLSSITLEGISGAVQTLVSTALGSLAQLDSRLSEVEAGVTALRALSLAALTPASASPAQAAPGAQVSTTALSLGEAQAAELVWLRHEVLRLGRRLQALEAPSVATTSLAEPVAAATKPATPAVLPDSNPGSNGPSAAAGLASE